MGPLQGLKIVEFEGLGPGPLAGMILADMGAEVTVLRRKTAGLGAALGGKADILNRGKYAVGVDLKQPEGVAFALDLLAQADGLIEGNRPGVMERLGLGPETVWARNPRLVYGRMTGWGQDGPLAQAAGHDLNYVALSGLLGLTGGRDAPPRPPPTLAGDAIGALGLAFGLLAGVFEARTSGRGQVVDAAIVDLVALLGNIAHWIAGSGQLGGEHRSPFYDSPFYDLYECSDGQWISLGPLEPQFYAELLKRLGLDDVEPAKQYDHREWTRLKLRLTDLFRTEPREHWCALLEGSDACFAPVLTPGEAAYHPHNLARNVYRTDPGLQANPAPRFSRTPGEVRTVGAGETGQLLSTLGEERLAALRAAGVLA